jgi:hypothetical protein
LAAAFFPAARCFLVAAAFFAVALRFVAFFMGGSISGRAIVVLTPGHAAIVLLPAQKRSSRRMRTVRRLPKVVKEPNPTWGAHNSSRLFRWRSLLAPERSNRRNTSCCLTAFTLAGTADEQDYSWRSVTIGSTFVARKTGI